MRKVVLLLAFIRGAAGFRAAPHAGAITCAMLIKVATGFGTVDTGFEPALVESATVAAGIGMTIGVTTESGSDSYCRAKPADIGSSGSCGPSAGNPLTWLHAGSGVSIWSPSGCYETCYDTATRQGASIPRTGYACNYGSESPICPTGLTMTGNIGDEGLKKFADVSGSMRSLTRLGLAGNNIGDEGIKSLVIEIAMGSLPNLQNLNLSDNNIGDEGIQWLAGIRFGSLTRLDLTKNQIGDAGLRALGIAITSGYLPKLKYLGLSGNNIGSSMQMGSILAYIRNAGVFVPSF